MARLQVSCASKRNRPDAYERISHIGGIANGAMWKHTSDDAVRYLNRKINTYFVIIDGRETEVVITERDGIKYLKTLRDNMSTDHFLNLEDCPL